MPLALRRPNPVHFQQWWPPEDPRHVPIAGVEKGPREDQGWGFVFPLSIGGAGWCPVLPGDFVLTTSSGQRIAMHEDTFTAEYEVILSSGERP